MYCWGTNSEGAQGTGDTANLDEPTVATLALDVAPYCSCGDSECETPETQTICFVDCGSCGDAVCTPYNESPTNCSADCTCGDGLCQAPEDAASCPADCDPTCGSVEECEDPPCPGTCDLAESSASCPLDCHICGDGLCYQPVEFDGSPSEVCPTDCSCGDYVCDPIEDPISCSKDCGFCGYGVCGFAETSYNCPSSSGGDCP